MKRLYILFLSFFCCFIFAQKYNAQSEQVWVDSVYKSLTLDEKIGQLFMVAAYTNQGKEKITELEKLVSKNKIGGLIFFQGGPVRQAKVCNSLQSKAKIPLLIGIDAEWGLSMRLDSTHVYPWNMTLGAIKDNSLIEKMGAQMGQQSRRLGVHFTFAPVVDINTNPKNPIIGNRSFGETKENVTEKSIAYMKGLQREGVFATAKHFPGHGDTATDSHHTLPVVNFTKERIHDIELYPYKELIKNGLASIMVAHLSIPSLESNSLLPTSISPKVVTDILKNELLFNGLIFTDALNMKGASNFKQPGDIDLAAFLAGNDVLLFPENVPLAVSKFENAYKNKILTEERLSYSVKKILQYKHKAGLSNYCPIELPNLYQDLNDVNYKALTLELYENAMTVLQNNDTLVPLRNLEKQKIAYVKIGDGASVNFVKKLRSYADVTVLQANTLDKTLPQLKNYSTVIIGYHKPEGIWKKNEMTFAEINTLDKIAKKNKNTIVVFFTKPYSLLKIPNYKHAKTVIQAYQNNDYTHTAVAEIIFGAIEAKGVLPVSLKKNFNSQTGINTPSIKRLGYAFPENVQVSSEKLEKIDQIANQAIQNKVAPGMQILVARKGKIIYQKEFGSHVYDSIAPVKDNDLYDLASLTKILGTLPLVMQDYDAKKINFKTTLSELLPDLKGSNKEKIELLDVLTHQGKLAAWIPFYKYTLDSLKKPSTQFYKTYKDKNFSIQVAKDLYIRNDFRDTIYYNIKNTDIATYKYYKYSDLGFILLKDYLEKSNNISLDKLVKNRFYDKLGAYTLTYNPLNSFPEEDIIPSEKDNYFRYQTVKGYVHDMASAMQGGVSGHAGLFANATDVAKMMQMYLQKGYYGGERFFAEETFDAFNTCYYCKMGNRRGVGFDKPQLGSEGPTCGCVPKSSFGHTGFTGTMVWADPENELVYVFLSNRTYPNSNINLLSKYNVRENIQKAIYQALIN
jgi:beta-N-acetylhexosaminidase